MKKVMMIYVAMLAFAACTPDNPTPDPTPDGSEQEWPLPANRTGYVVEEITRYSDENNHKEATYEYDENNRLVKRTLNCTYQEWPGVKHTTYVDSIVYQNGRVSRIIQTVTPDDHLWHPDILFYYDNKNRLVRTEYGDNITCYGYHNGRLDSIYSPYGDDYYTILEYDNVGNIVRERYRTSELNLVGEPTGVFYFRTEEYEYDNNPRPNFNMDNAFIYEPVFGMGTTYPGYIRNLSKNNMTRYSAGPEIWEYEYNEQGLPETMYHQFADNVLTNHPVWRFKYRRVE